MAPSLNVYYATGKWERGLYWWGEGPADGRTVGRYTGVAIKAKALATAVRHSSPSFIMSGCNARGQPGYVDGKHAGPSYLQCINDFLNTGVSINACFGERRELALIRPISQLACGRLSRNFSRNLRYGREGPKVARKLRCPGSGAVHPSSCSS